MKTLPKPLLPLILSAFFSIFFSVSLCAFAPDSTSVDINSNPKDSTANAQTFLPPKTDTGPDAVYSAPKKNNPAAVLRNEKLQKVELKTETAAIVDSAGNLSIDNDTSFLITSQDSLRCVNNLVDDLDRLINRIGDTKLSVAIYSIDQDKYIYKKNYDTPLTPASNTKLLTSFCAFDRFGPNYLVKTKIYIDDKDISDGIVNGNVIVEGSGDALLKISDIEFIADQMKALGIKKITGNIYADGTYFDDMTNRKDYSGDDDEVEKLPPIVALGLERNTATVVVTAGSTAGVPVNVQVIPASESFKISNVAKVKGRSKRADLFDNEPTDDADEDAEEYAYESAYESADELFFADTAYYLRAGDELIAMAASRRKTTCSIVSKWDATAGKQVFSINGSLAPNKTYSNRYYIMEPDLAVAGTLKNRLISGGIEVVGKIEKIQNKKDGRDKFYMLCEFGRDIKNLINPINTNSDNYLAETMFKMIGASAKYNPHTGLSAQMLEKEILASYQIPFNGCLINDGSGLSRRNVVTTHTLCELLISVYYSDFYEDFVNSLTVAGEGTGTLRKRMKMSPAEGNLHAKTGTLKNVSALSGFVTSINGERFVFSCLFNGWAVGTYKNTENEIGNLLSSFFYYNKQK